MGAASRLYWGAASHKIGTQVCRANPRVWCAIVTCKCQEVVGLNGPWALEHGLWIHCTRGSLLWESDPTTRTHLWLRGVSLHLLPVSRAPHSICLPLKSLRRLFSQPRFLLHYLPFNVNHLWIDIIPPLRRLAVYPQRAS